MTEAVYRYRLYNLDPHKFAPISFAAHPTVWFFQNPVWQFSAEFGFTYIPNSVWQTGLIRDGAVAGCDGTAITNHLGNMGAIRQPYENAQVKILLFGDSVAAVTRGNNQTYASILEDQLQAKLNKTVSVMNLGRGGYGVLQMFDLARRKVIEYRPDLVIFAPITQDFTRGRFWQTLNVIKGRKRMLTTTEPHEKADLANSTDTVILNERASQAWCDSMIKEKRLGDPIVAEIEESYRDILRQNSERPSVFALENSFVYHRLVHGNPFYFVYRRLRPSTNPRINLTDYATDARMVENVGALADSGVPYVLLHLPEYNELTERQYIVTDQEHALRASLSALTRQPFYGTLNYSNLDTRDLAQFKEDPTDGVHPSLWGLKYHAEATVKLLQENGYLLPLQSL